MAKSKGKVVSRKQKGRLSLPAAGKKDLAFDELADRVLSELAVMAELEQAGVRPYKLVLIVKRTKRSPLSYKLVVERGELE